MLTLSEEEKTILLLSRLNPSNDDIECVKHLLTKQSAQNNFDKFLQLAISNGVAQLLYRNLKNVDILPEEVLSRLRNVYLHSADGNLRKARELFRLLDLLNSKGIEAIPLKGVLASEFIFRDPGLYYGVDIDILVKPSELQKVKQILIDVGYGYDESKEQDMLSSHYHLVFEKDEHLVEVHWNLVKRYFDIPPEFWWKDAYADRYESKDIICLSHEKYLICTIFRVFSHIFTPLKFLVLVSELCNRHYDQLDWPLFMKFTKQYKMEKLTTFTLKLSSELLGTKVPNDILSRHVAGYDFFKTCIIRQLFRDVKRFFLTKPLYVLLLDSPLHIMSYYFKRIFPEASELRLRYDIPEGSKTVFIYYVLNPILLPLLIVRKKIK